MFLEVISFVIVDLRLVCLLWKLKELKEGPIIVDIISNFGKLLNQSRYKKSYFCGEERKIQNKMFDFGLSNFFKKIEQLRFHYFW